MTWRDATFIVGLVSIAFGIWCIHQPSAFIFAGLSVSGIAYLTSPEEKEPEHDEPAE